MVKDTSSKMETLRRRIDGSSFEESVFRLKEENARLVTISCQRSLDGPLNLLYYFQKERRLIILELAVIENTVPSLYSIFTKADFIEREINNTFGIKFLGHPNLERIVGKNTIEPKVSFYEKKAVKSENEN